MTGASVSIRTDGRIVWWRPLVHWLLCIPHLIYNAILQAVAAVVWLVTALWVVAAGRVPARLAEFQVFALRERVRTYSHFFVLRSSYPPFATEVTSIDPGDDPEVHVSATGPIRVPRWTPIVRPFVVLPSVLVLLPIGLLLDALYPVLMIAAVVNDGWPQRWASFLVRIEEWAGEVLLYLFMATDHVPRFGFATATAEVDVRPARAAVVIGPGVAVGVGSQGASVTKSISRSTAPTSAGSRSA